MIDTIINFFEGILTTPIFELFGIQFIALILTGITGTWLSWQILKIVWKIIKVIFKLLVNIFSAKKHCQKIQCRHCGRTLDKCTCQNNKKAWNFVRLYRYKKETRAIKASKKNS